MRQIIFSNNCKASCTKTMYKIIDAMLMLYIIRCALYIERFAVQYGVNVVHIFRIFKYVISGINPDKYRAAEIKEV